MNSTFFVRWKGFYGSVLVTVILFVCFLGGSSSQEDSQDQAAIEQALRDALLTETDLPSGLPWKLERSNTIWGTPIVVDQLWDAYVGTYPNQRNYHIAVQIRYHPDRFTSRRF